jgi:hypothetical protein
MTQQEESTSKKQLTQEQINELMSYPDYWRHILTKAAERGESIKEVYEELKDLEHLT